MSIRHKQTLCERLTFDQAGIVLETAEPAVAGGQRPLFLKGIFLQGGVRNLNERNYPVREISKAVDAMNEILGRGESILGELDHPEELTVGVKNVSHMITSMWMDGNMGMGKLKVLNTPMGNIVRALVEDGVKLGVSSRGSGNVNDKGEVSDFDIITVDIVARPSAPNAFPKPVYESLNTRRGRVIHELATAVSHDPKAQRFLIEELRRVIGRLS